MINTTKERDESHNPYAAPQAELDAAKPKAIYVNKFNGKLALWSSLAVGLVLVALIIPEIETDRTPPRTIIDEITRYTIIAVVSIGLGIFLGTFSGTPASQTISDPDTEEPIPR